MTMNIGALIDATNTPDQSPQTRPQIGEPWYVTKAREQGLMEAPIRINDKTRSNAVTSYQNEHVAAYGGLLGTAVDRRTGMPVDVLAGNINEQNVIVTLTTPSGTQIPCSLAAAINMGAVVVRNGEYYGAEEYARHQKAPAGTSGQPAGQQHPAEGQPAGTAGDTDADPEVIAKAPLFDDEANAELGLAYSALTASGFEPNAAIYDLIQEGATADSPAIVAISRATGETPEHVAGWMQDIQQLAIDKVADVVAGYGYGPELLTAVYESSPGAVHQAQLSALNSGSLAPLIRIVADYLEQHPQARFTFAKQ